MRASVWIFAGYLLSAASASVWGASITLNGFNLGEATVTITEGVGGDFISVGTCVGNSCVIGGVVSGPMLPWSISSAPIPFTFTDSTDGTFVAPDNTGSVTVSTPTLGDGGQDSAQGFATLSTFTEPSLGSATVLGSVTLNSGGDDLNYPTQLAAFQLLLETVGGFGQTIVDGFLPVVTGTVWLDIGLTNCMSGGAAVACFPDPVSETITGTVSSITLTSAVPEPGSLALLSLGMVALAARRRRRRSATKKRSSDRY